MCALVDSWLSGLKKAPKLSSKRLSIRPISAGDAAYIQAGVNDKRVCDNLSYTPNPYTIEMAECWVRNVNNSMAQDQCCYWTICSKPIDGFIGSIGLSLNKEQESGEIHYWVAADEWNKGYCTEACKTVITHFFEDLKMHRLFVTHREDNLSSKKVISKCGFIFEGSQRDALKRFGKFENVIAYSLLSHEFLALKEKGIY